ncbi:MFS transporter [Arthrobacter sp. GCM10027362]|uniref:MFS transporter n=1 Tax=Arthrobacter sp. GCM10027362 TaxID=3273379 RepID=UPI0036448905
MIPSAVQTPASRSAEAAHRRNGRLALVSSYIGSSLEMYDFLLYGTAASLVFPSLFFAGVDPAVAVALSFVTLAAGYVARPVGGIVFGHFGDRLGRKKMLVVTMGMMGAVSILVGLLPTAAQIGIAAPIALVTLRIVQGIAMGGEWAGATLMSMEHSKPERRGLGASIAVSGGPSGAVLATLVLGAFALLPEEDFMAWGWRVPFLLSLVLLAVGLFLRIRVKESPDFEKARSSEPEHRGIPLVQVLRRYPTEVALSVVGGLAPLFMQSLLATFALGYAVQVGHGRSDALLMLTIANAVHIFTIPAAAMLSDKLGRRNVMVAGAVLGVAGIWPMFALIDSGSTWLMLLGFIIGNPLVQALMYGPMGAWIGEMFSTKTRYTGLSLSYQLATTLGAGFAPLIANALVQADGGSTTLLAAFFGLLCVISALAFFLAKDRKATED